MSAALRGPLRTVFMRWMYLERVSSFSLSPPGFPGSLESDMAANGESGSNRARSASSSQGE